MLISTTPAFAQYSLAVADFDTDEKDDLVVVNNSNNYVSVLLGNGSGNFKSAVQYKTAFAPAYIVTGDLNNDGVPDIVTGNSDPSDGVSVLIAKGDGTFKAYQEYPINAAILSEALADFNGDGFLDLVTVNNQAASASILLGIGDGTFGPQKTFGIPILSYSVTVADFDGDKKLDLAFSSGERDSISIYVGRGDGTFSEPTQLYFTGNQPRQIITADFNGDGKPDLATANNGGNSASQDGVSVLLNDNGNFPARKDYAAGDQPISLLAGDFNGDGKPDLAVVAYLGKTFSILLNQGDGSFSMTPSHSYSLNAYPYFVASGDFNQDKILDLVVSQYNDYVFVSLGY